MQQFHDATMATVERLPGRMIQERLKREYGLVLIDQGEALVVELEREDKVLTIRNRIKRATEALGLENVTIRRRGERVVAYQVSEDA